MLGCFAVWKLKKKRNSQVINRNPSDTREAISVKLPEPEPEPSRPSLQSAPPSFRNRGRPSHSRSKASNARARALSAPSSLDDDHNAISGAEVDDGDPTRSREGSVKEQHRFSNPLPLPLPSPESYSTLRNLGSFKASNFSAPIATSGPLPLPPAGLGGLHNYHYEEILVACNHFSSDNCIFINAATIAYKAVFRDDTSGGSKRAEATVIRFLHPSQGLKEFMSELNVLASLHHPNLCKLLGYHGREVSNGRMLVYERLHYGSLEGLLHGRPFGPSIDWTGRMKVALCAARGLAFLHEEGPFQAMYSEFSASNIQVDKDFTAKLSGYGCVNSNAETDAAVAAAAVVPDALDRLPLTPKSNVWSFGVVLLEILTGRSNHDLIHPKEERNLVKWSRTFLSDDCRLSLIMDSRIKGRVPPKAARTVADIIIKCLNKDPSERPTMRAIVNLLGNVQDMKYPCLYPLQEPAAAAAAAAAATSTGKVFMKSASLNCILPRPQHHHATLATLSPPIKIHSVPSSQQQQLPTLTCAAMLTSDDVPTSSSIRRSPAALPPAHPSRVEGF